MLVNQPEFELTPAQRLWQLLTNDTLIVLMSQAFVSGTNFLTSLIVGNASGADGLGYYALGFSILVFACGFQSALISIPYTVFFIRESDVNRPARANSSYVNHVLLAVLLTSVISVFSVGLWLQGFYAESRIGWGLVFAIPFFISREFIRRIHFADNQYHKALRIDFFTTVIQVGSLIALWWTDLLTPVNAIVCIGIGCFCSTVGFIVEKFRVARFQRERLVIDARNDWQFGKWLLVEQLFTVASAYAMPWLLALLLDQTSVGIFAACFAIAGLSNPFLQAIGSYSLPRFAKLVSTRNRSAMEKSIWRITAMAAAVMSGFFVVCLLMGDSLLQMLFRDPEFTGYGLVVGVLAGRAVIGSLGLAAHYYLLAIEKPQVSLIASLASIVVMTVMAIYLVPLNGIIGAAYSWLLGTLAESVIMIVGYASLRPALLEGKWKNV